MEGNEYSHQNQMYVFIVQEPNRNDYRLSSVGSNMRAKTVTHVEYEVFNLILAEIDVGELRDEMVPRGDRVADKRFSDGVASAARLIQNLIDRRTHRLPKNHPDYKEK